MITSRSRSLLVMTALLPLLAAGCDQQPLDPAGQPGEPVSLNISAQVGSDTDVQLLTVEVTAADIPQPLVANFPVLDGSASGEITVPAGEQRTFTARAFDSTGEVTHEGSVLQDIRRGQTIVRIPLLPLGVGVPIHIAFSSFTITIDPKEAWIDVSEIQQFTATVTDNDGNVVQNPTLTWASTNPVVAIVDESGLATAGIQGSTQIVVSHNGMSASADLTVDGSPDGLDLLEITMSSPTDSVAPGESITITPTVTNHGAVGVQNIAFWITSSPIHGFSSTTTHCDVAGHYSSDGDGVVLWLCVVDGELGPGMSTTTTVTAVTRSDLCVDQIVTDAGIHEWEGPEDPYLTNNTATLYTPMTCPETITATESVVFTSDRDGASDLYTMRPDGTNLVRLTANSHVETDPAWSPDRSRIAFIRGGSLWVINANGTGETQLNIPADNSPTWSPDGTRIAVSGTPPGSTTRHILVFDLAAGSYTNLTGSVTGVDDWSGPDWSPDGTELLAIGSDEWSKYIRLIAEDGSYARTLTASHLGTCLAVEGNIDSARWATNANSISFSRDNKVAILREGPDEHGATCPGGFGAIESFLDDPNYAYGSTAWSPDGAYIAFERRENYSSGKFDVMAIRSDGTGLFHNLTNQPASNDMTPDW